MTDFDTENERGICTNKYRVNMIAYNDQTRVAVGFAPRCKLWSCPQCGKTNAYLWKIRTRIGVQQLLLDGVELRFLTLTSHGKLNARQSMYVWPKAWKAFRTRVQRAAELDFYIAVPERQPKSGRLHLHILESWNLDTRWYKDNSAETGLGFMALEEEMPTPNQAGWYVCKYLTKSIENPEEWPKGFRRVRCSQTWPILERQINEYRFERVGDPGDGQRKLDVAAMSGYEIFIADHKEAWDILEG